MHGASGESEEAFGSSTCSWRRVTPTACAHQVEEVGALLLTQVAVTKGHERYTAHRCAS